MKKKRSHPLVLLFITLFPLVLMGSGLYFCCRSTGFGLEKITSKLSYNDAWDIEPISDKQRELLTQKIFPQTFYYLATGNHCYAFISEDKGYVLKFFKMQHLFPKGWLTGLKRETSNQLFSERIFASYKDAYESLSDETGLLYIHLNKTREFGTKVTLIDNKGKKHFVDLDATEFLVQKRATKIHTHLKQLFDQDRMEELRASIRSFFQLIAARCEKGFVDHDLSIRNNFGFIGTKAIQFDCATLTRDSSMKYPANFRKEIMDIAERLDLWARDNFPEITLFIQDEAQRLINLNEEAQ